MTDVKQILVVDDHFEMLEFLRSMLELSSEDYQVLGVPSAEEGFLELRRTPFDLLITDVRLPGMSGFEFVRRVQQYQSDIPIIMITAYSSPQGKQEAESLGIYRYFQKPLDTDALLAAVHSSLYGDVIEVIAAPAPVEGEGRPAPDVVDEAARARVRALRTDTGAAQAVLAHIDGRVLLQVGERRNLDISRLTQTVANSLRHGFLLAEQLQSVEPFTIQYQAGDRVDLYTANVGRHYFIMLIFDAQARRGRIGTVWIFAQRAAKELQQVLPVPAADETAPAERAAGAATPAEEEGPVARKEAGAAQDVAVAPGMAEEEEAPAVVLTEDDLAEAGELVELLELQGTEEEVDLEAYWDEALSDSGEGAPMAGLSFEEALRRGLLPSEFDASEDE